MHIIPIKYIQNIHTIRAEHFDTLKHNTLNDLIISLSCFLFGDYNMIARSQD